MSARRIAVIAASGALVVGGGGAAIAAVSLGGDRQKTEDAILADAAKRLNVAPDTLREALGAAEDAQLDEAVKSGDLTQKQADAIKQHRKDSGAVLGRPLGPGGPIFPHGGPRMGGPPGPFGPGPGFRHPGGRAFGLFPELARALGLTDKELVAKLRSGTSIGAIAKQQGKSLDDVRRAVEAAAKTRADKAVKDGDLTRKQADALLRRLDEHLKHVDQAPRLRFRERGEQRMFAPGGNRRPGSFVPAPQPAPALDGPGSVR